MLGLWGLYSLMKQNGLDSSNSFRAVPPFYVSAPPMLLLWQTVMAKKGRVPVSERRVKAGAALSSWTGTEHIQLLSPEPQQPSCNTDSLLLLQRLLDQILQRNNSWEPTAAWRGEPRPCQPHNWPFCGSWFSCRCLSTPFHVNLNICSSER